MKAQEYKLVFGDNGRELSEEVNKLLSEGYKLWGGIAMIPETERTCFQLCQAMIKEAE